MVSRHILAAAAYTVRRAQKPENQAAVTYMSVGIAFATFVGVLVHHTYQQVWPNLQQRIHLLTIAGSSRVRVLRKQVLITKHKLPL